MRLLFSLLLGPLILSMAACPTCELSVENATGVDLGRVGLVHLDEETHHNVTCPLPPETILIDDGSLTAGRIVSTELDLGRYRVYVRPGDETGSHHYYPDILSCVDGEFLEAVIRPEHVEEAFQICASFD